MADILRIDGKKINNLNTLEAIASTLSASRTEMEQIDEALLNDEALLLAAKTPLQSRKVHVQNRITSLRSNMGSLKNIIDEDPDYSVAEKKEYADALEAEV